MTDNPTTKEQENVPMFGRYVKPELWKDFEDLAEEDRCSAEEEFSKLVAKGRILDTLLRKGVRVTVYIDGKEEPIENFVDPVMDKIKNQLNSKPVAP